MSRMTLRLPATLHHQLASQAEREGVSLNQYIVYALTRHLTQSYTVHALSEAAVTQQHAEFTALLQALGQASPEVVTEAFATREQSELDPTLTPEVVARLRARLAHVS